MRVTGKRLALASVLMAVVAAAIAVFALRAGDPTAFASGTRVELAAYHGRDPTGVPAAMTGGDLVARGAYLARAADCVGCHTAPGGKPFAGGLPFKLPFGTLYSPNITSDQETGIGAWSDSDFVRALHDGIGRNGEHLYPAFPYASYTLMTGDDALAIKAYLFSLAPVRSRPPANEMSFPFDQRYLMAFWNVLFNPSQRFRPDADQTPEWNRGAYLVEALGHCGECHTPRNLLQGLRSGQKFAGTTINGWRAYNITADPVSGIGGWSDAELAAYLSTGHAQGRGSAAGPMGEAVSNSLRFLSRDDVGAMVAYLRSVPPIGVRANPTQRSAAAPGGDDKLGLHVFEGACASCHDRDGSGAITAYAALAGSRGVADAAAVNATQVVLQGAHLPSAHGDVFMPRFDRAYSDADIAAVVGYVTAKFGATASAMTANDVERRRQSE